MGETTAISWTDHTFNPWWGCVKVSPACDHCYAETFSKRVGQHVWGKGAPRRFFGDKHWAEPLKWERAAVKSGVRRRVFCASMADVFENRGELLDEARARLWTLITDTPHLDWQLLTKRPANIRRMIPSQWAHEQWPSNVWVGITAETQDWLETRGYWMERINPAVLFISYEPALGLIRVPRWAQWVIAGGESGDRHRTPDVNWFRSVRDQCVDLGVAFWFKQHGGRTPAANGCELDGREWKQFPSLVA